MSVSPLYPFVAEPTKRQEFKKFYTAILFYTRSFYQKSVESKKKCALYLKCMFYSK